MTPWLCFLPSYNLVVYRQFGYPVQPRKEPVEPFRSFNSLPHLGQVDIKALCFGSSNGKPSYLISSRSKVVALPLSRCCRSWNKLIASWGVSQRTLRSMDFLIILPVWSVSTEELIWILFIVASIEFNLVINAWSLIELIGASTGLANINGERMVGVEKSTRVEVLPFVFTFPTASFSSGNYFRILEELVSLSHKKWKIPRVTLTKGINLFS